MSVTPTTFSGPYRGLEPFDESAMDFFFGRERESSLVVASLYAAPLTLLYGVSGVGKSSVLRAGVLPELRKREDVLPVVYPRFARQGQRLEVERGWQASPLSGVKETAAMALADSAPRGSEKYRRYRDVVLENDMAPLGPFLEAIARASDKLVMVILDQFEEYSLYHPKNDELFAQQFPGAVAARNRNIAFLVSLREDALARLDRFKTSIPTLWDNYRRIEHLSRKAGEEAIRGPLAVYNQRLQPGERSFVIDDDLVEAVLNQVSAGRVRLTDKGRGTVAPASLSDRIETPYLQLVMTRLWDREHQANSGRLSMETLNREGDAEEIVRSHLDGVMAQFSPGERDVSARMFDELVTPSGAKIAMSAADMAERAGFSEEAVRPILQRLEEGDRRILRRVADPEDPQAEPRYEIFHDRLGLAMLAWSTEHSSEQKREQAARQQVEQKRVVDQSIREAATRVDEALRALSDNGQRIFVAVLFMLVDSKGVRRPQTIEAMGAQSRESPSAIERVLTRLERSGLLRQMTAPPGLAAVPYQIVDDATAAAFLEWHSRYLVGETGGAKRKSGRLPGPAAEKAARQDILNAFPYRLVQELLLRGDVIPFLGAGVPLSVRSTGGSSKVLAGGPPSNEELKRVLAQVCDYPPTEFDSSDISEVASYLVQRFGRIELDLKLQELIGRPSVTPSVTHGLLADMAKERPLLILTTNYDRLMEVALQNVSAVFDVLSYVPDSSDRRDCLAFRRHGETKATILPVSKVLGGRDRTLLFRLHGGGDEEPGSYVLTEEDQIDWILRLRGRASWLVPFVAEALDNFHLLSLGHSARGWSQRALLRTVAGRSSRKASWAVSLTRRR